MQVETDRGRRGEIKRVAGNYKNREGDGGRGEKRVRERSKR